MFHNSMNYDLSIQMEKLDYKIHFHGVANCCFLTDHLRRPTRSYDSGLYIFFIFLVYFTYLVELNFSDLGKFNLIDL